MRGAVDGRPDGLPPASSMRAQIAFLIGERRGVVVTIAALSVVVGFCEAALLAIVAQVAAALVSKAAHVHVRIAAVGIHTSVDRLLYLGLALSLLRAALQWPLAILPVGVAADVQANLRTRILRSYSDASWAVQSQDREGTLQEVLTNQSVQAAQGALQATGLLIGSISFVILLVTAVALNPLAAGIVVIVAVALFSVFRPFRNLGARRARELSAAQITYAEGIAETNRLAEESRVFGVTDAQQTRVTHLILVCRGLFFRSNLIVRLVPNLYQTLIFIVLILGLIALHRYGVGNAGSLGAVVLLFVRASQAGQQIQSYIQALQQSLPFLDRLQATEKRYAENRIHAGDGHLDTIRTVAFEEVSFAYVPGRPVLQDVSFTVEAGEAIGIVGPSGAGKSTLVHVLLQLRAPTTGRYVVNGEEVGSFARPDWTRLVAYVAQEPRLMHGTVAENVRFYRDIDDDAVERACRLARVHEDIESWSGGYERIVGPRADAVSGGQQQRLCLARALAARPQVLVLDEPTSALDPHSEALIQESLTALKGELTMFTIAHRLSTLDACDRVMVIIDGRLVAFDTRAVLQEQNDYYRSASMIAAGTAGGVLP